MSQSPTTADATLHHLYGSVCQDLLQDITVSYFAIDNSRVLGSYLHTISHFHGSVLYWNVPI